MVNVCMRIYKFDCQTIDCKTIDCQTIDRKRSTVNDRLQTIDCQTIDYKRSTVKRSTVKRDRLQNDRLSNDRLHTIDCKKIDVKRSIAKQSTVKRSTAKRGGSWRVQLPVADSYCHHLVPTCSLKMSIMISKKTFYPGWTFGWIVCLLASTANCNKASSTPYPTGEIRGHYYKRIVK